MVDVVIIGGGIVGLSTAYQLLKQNRYLKIAIVEKESGFGLHQTGNNSGVIHSGIYYKPGSLKSRNCRRGVKLLLEFCNDYGISYDICRKVIVATNSNEDEGLNVLLDRGKKNGLVGLKKIGEMDTELFHEFFKAFSNESKCNLHIENLYGKNNHHIIESCFKAFAKSLRFAVEIDHRRKDIIPSSKGTL